MRLAGLAVAFAAVLLAHGRAEPRIDRLRATGALPAHITGRFQQVIGFQQTDAGVYYVFDRRAHTVYTVAPGADAPHQLLSLGAEPGRVLDPSAFDVDPSDGSFVIADAPGGRQRIQTFTNTLGALGAFLLPGRSVPRITLGTFVLNGVGSLQYTGTSILLNQPSTGSLVTEYGFDGSIKRTFGQLRQTGHESDPDVHIAMNVGLPLVDPTGGFFFVFQAGIPMFRKYDAKGQVVFERHIEGPELDEYVRTLPTTWPRRRAGEGDVIPLVLPVVRTAAVDRSGRLWVSLTMPYTYVYDAEGEKVRTVQFQAARLISPDGLFFAHDGRLLVTPGCYEFPGNW